MAGNDASADNVAAPARLLAPPVPAQPQVQQTEGQHRSSGLGLSAKLLLLTLGFVMLAEILIFVPSVANFRNNWLMERLQASQVAGLAAEAAPDGKLPEMLRQELLQAAHVIGIAIKRQDRRQLILSPEMPPAIDYHYDLRSGSIAGKILDALAVFLHPDGQVIRVIGTPDMSGDSPVEVVMSETPLRHAMIGFGLSILGLSLIISAITGSLVYLALNRLLVGPMRRITEGIVRFAANPQDASRIITPTRRSDEIGIAEQAIATTQRDLREMLQHRSRLAALGLAVSKINHDLRNILANAQILSDRLGTVKDPTVERATPKLIASLDRAIRLCEATLKYGEASEPLPQRRLIQLRPLIEDVGESLGLPFSPSVTLSIDVPSDLMVDADPDQLHRVLTNLCRNAIQALEPGPRAQRGQISVSGRRERASCVIEVQDNGPGVPPRAQANLFRAFQGAARPGGTGLGLAIVQDLVSAHGGRITLAATGPGGTTFRIEIPDRAG